MKTALVWFKTDLRIQDNETLIAAISKSDQILPVYCLDEAHFATTSYGFQKTGSFRAQFLLESLQDLDSQLRTLGSGLLVVKGKPEEELPKLVRAYQVQKVYAKREVAFEENKTEKAVQSALFKLGCEFESISTSTLYHAEDLPFSIKDIPEVFTNFRKKTEKDAEIRAPFAAPTRISSPKIPPLALPDLAELGLKKTTIDSRAVLQFAGGERAAIQRVKHYLFDTQLLSTYKETRNGMVGADYSSKFSPWLALGCVSPRYIYAEVQRYEAQFPQLLLTS